MKAAVKSYFGIDLKDIDPAQAAIIAGAAQVALELRPRAQRHRALHDHVVEEGADCPKSQLVVPADHARSSSVATRSSTSSRRVGRRCRASEYSAAQFTVAKREDVVLGSQSTARWIAPHFVWAVRDELADKLCGVDVPSCDALDLGGLRVTTTLDAKLQKTAEKWVSAAAIVPNRKDMTAAAKALGFKKVEPWMTNLKSKDLHNSALVAVDYETGELVAYVGSADYYAASTKPEFQPQYDVVGKGYRQPGSAFKPFNYAVGIDDGTITAGTMLDGRRHRLRGRLHPERRRPARARPGPRPERPPVLAEHPVGQDDGPQQARPRLREGAGIRDAVPGRPDGRAGARPRRPGGPPGRPRVGLRHARQRR